MLPWALSYLNCYIQVLTSHLSFIIRNGIFIIEIFFVEYFLLQWTFLSASNKCESALVSPTQSSFLNMINLRANANRWDVWQLEIRRHCSVKKYELNNGIVVLCCCSLPAPFLPSRCEIFHFQHKLIIIVLARMLDWIRYWTFLLSFFYWLAFRFFFYSCFSFVSPFVFWCFHRTWKEQKRYLYFFFCLFVWL